MSNLITVDVDTLKEVYVDLDNKISLTSFLVGKGITGTVPLSRILEDVGLYWTGKILELLPEHSILYRHYCWWCVTQASQLLDSSEGVSYLHTCWEYIQGKVGDKELLQSSKSAYIRHYILAGEVAWDYWSLRLEKNLDNLKANARAELMYAIAAASELNINLFDVTHHLRLATWPLGLYEELDKRVIRKLTSILNAGEWVDVSEEDFITGSIGKLGTKQKFDLRYKCKYCGGDFSGEDFIINTKGGG